MKRGKLTPLSIITSESGDHTGVLMAWEVQIHYPRQSPIKTPPRSLKSDSEKMLLKRNISLLQELRRLEHENAEVTEAYQHLNREYKALKRLLSEKLAN